MWGSTLDGLAVAELPPSWERWTAPFALRRGARGPPTSGALALEEAPLRASLACAACARVRREVTKRSPMDSYSAAVESRAPIVRRVSMTLVLVFAALAFAAPDPLNAAVQRTFRLTIEHFGWFYLLATASFIVFLLVLALGRSGRMRLGGQGETPAFGFWSWVAMLFTAGMGVGLVFWGVAEPMYHYLEPPHGDVPPQSAEAARKALEVSVFHWGLHQWANYAVVALAIAWVRFRKESPGLISSTFRPLLGDRRCAQWSPWLDAPAVIATTFGVATTLGFGILQINGGLQVLAGVPVAPFVQILIVLVVTAAFLGSAMTGIERGILQLSRLNMVLATLLALAVFVLGPTSFLLNAGTQALGDVLDNLVALSLRTAPWIESTWAGEWTVFYWAWGLSWAPFVGTFIARISRGRTIAEFVTGVMVVPAAVSLGWFTVFGGSALHAERYGEAGLAELVQQDTSLALFGLLDTLPASALLATLALALIFIFLVTSADSAAYVLGMFTEGGVLTPTRRARVTQGLLLALLSIALLWTGGLEALRTLSITVALPFLLVLVGMAAGLWRSVQETLAEIEGESRVL